MSPRSRPEDTITEKLAAERVVSLSFPELPQPASGRPMSIDELVMQVCDHDYQISGEGYLPPLDMPPARLPNGKELERIYWREDTCRKCGHAVRVV